MTRSRLKFIGTLLVWCIAACLLVMLHGCSAAQVQKTKAHAVEVAFAGAGGAAWVAVAGPAGPFIFLGLSVVGVLVNEELQPAEGVTVVTIGADGKKKVEHFDPKERAGNAPEFEHWYERVWTAVQVAWWVFVLLFVLTHAKLRGALIGVIGWAWGFAGRKAMQLIGMLKKKEH